MRIAVIGSGVSGLTTAWLLHEAHEVTLFEADSRLGGHTHTVDVEDGGDRLAIDTGFIVFNLVTYPNFLRLMERLGVTWQTAPMSFSVRCAATGLEYASATLGQVYAQRRNLLSPRFHRMVMDIVRFFRDAKRLAREGDDTISLDDFLRAGRYGDTFRRVFLLPMLAAIWSSSPEATAAFPARHFMRFFENHGLLNLLGGPQWQVLRGGSRAYLEPITRGYADRIRLNTPVTSVRRTGDGVCVTSAGVGEERFDHVVIATHSDQALAMLAEPTDAERAVLGAIPYQANETVLHTDTSLLPRTRRAWASWNYFLPQGGSALPTVTYNMNMLQTLASRRTWCVSLNQSDAVDPAAVRRTLVYEHPHYTPEGIAAQARHAEVSGVGGIHYCGAYWGYGFHEDGVKSALRVCEHFGAGLPG